MTKMISVNIETNGYGVSDPKDWANEISNVYADVELANLSVSGNMISFKMGFSGMDDTSPEDVKTKIEEYLTMNEAFEARNISCH
jgi:hypothetical protein